MRECLIVITVILNLTPLARQAESAGCAGCGACDVPVTAPDSRGSIIHRQPGTLRRLIAMPCPVALVNFRDSIHRRAANSRVRQGGGASFVKRKATLRDK